MYWNKADEVLEYYKSVFLLLMVSIMVFLYVWLSLEFLNFGFLSFMFVIGCVTLLWAGVHAAIKVKKMTDEK